MWRFAFWWVLPVDVCGCQSAHHLSSPFSTPPSSSYYLLLMFWFPPPTPPPPPPFKNLPRVRCPHSATQWFGRETQGPSVSPLEPPGPFRNQIFLIPHSPTTVLTPVFPASELHWPHAGVEGGECAAVTMILHLHRNPTPKPPRMPCVCVLCIHHPHPLKNINKKKTKRGLDGL